MLYFLVFPSFFYLFCFIFSVFFCSVSWLFFFMSLSLFFSLFAELFSHYSTSMFFNGFYSVYILFYTVQCKIATQQITKHMKLKHRCITDMFGCTVGK